MTNSPRYCHKVFLPKSMARRTSECRKQLSLVVQQIFLQSRNLLFSVQLLHLWSSRVYFQAESTNHYFDVAMNNFLAMTKIQCVSNCKHDLRDLAFFTTTMKISLRIELPSLTIFHDDVKVSGIIVDFIYLNDVGVFELNELESTESNI